MADKWEQMATVDEPADKWESKATPIEEVKKKSASETTSTSSTYPVSQPTTPSNQNGASNDVPAQFLATPESEAESRAAIAKLVKPNPRQIEEEMPQKIEQHASLVDEHHKQSDVLGVANMYSFMPQLNNLAQQIESTMGAKTKQDIGNHNTLVKQYRDILKQPVSQYEQPEPGQPVNINGQQITLIKDMGAYRKQLRDKTPELKDAQTVGDFVKAAGQASQKMGELIPQIRQSQSEIDNTIADYRKETGYKADEMGFTDSFVHGFSGALQDMAQYMMPKEQAAKVMEQRYYHDNVLAPAISPEGTNFASIKAGIGETAGGLTPFVLGSVAAGMATGGGAALPILTDIALGATMEGGAQGYATYSQLRSEGKTHDEAAAIASRVSNVAAATGGVTFGIMGAMGGGSISRAVNNAVTEGITGQTVQKTFTDGLLDEFKKQGIIAPIFGANAFMQDLYKKYGEHMDINPTDRIIPSMMSAAVIGLASHGLTTGFKTLGAGTKDLYTTAVAKYNAQGIDKAVGEAVRNGSVDTYTGAQITDDVLTRAAAIKQLPDLPLAQTMEVAPIVERNQALLKAKKNSDGSVPDTRIDGEIEQNQRLIDEKLGTPLTIDEQSTLGELESRNTEKGDDGKLKKPLTEVENDLMKHLQARQKSNVAANSIDETPQRVIYKDGRSGLLMKNEDGDIEFQPDGNSKAVVFSKGETIDNKSIKQLGFRSPSNETLSEPNSQIVSGDVKVGSDVIYKGKKYEITENKNAPDGIKTDKDGNVRVIYLKNKEDGSRIVVGEDNPDGVSLISDANKLLGNAESKITTDEPTGQTTNVGGGENKGAEGGRAAEIVGAKPNPIDEASIAASVKWIKDLYDLPEGTIIKDKDGNLYRTKKRNKWNTIESIKVDENGKVVDSKRVHTLGGNDPVPDFFKTGYEILPDETKTNVGGANEENVSGTSDATKNKTGSEGEQNAPVDNGNNREIALGFAPYRSKNVSTLEGDAEIRNSEDYKLHQQILTDAANKLGIKILSNNDTWGGYVDSETGKPVQEVSNIVRVNATPERAELLAAVLGKAAPELQDSVLIGNYNENGEGLEHVIKTGSFENAQEAIGYLKESGIQHFTIDKNNGDITILDTDRTKSENINSFISKLDENGIKSEHDIADIEARFLHQGEYDSVLRKQGGKAHPEEGGDIDALIEESRRRYEEIKSSQNASNEEKLLAQEIKGKDKIARGLDKLNTIIGGKKNIIADEDKPTVIDALRDIGEGLIEEGVATTKNVVQKIREYLGDKMSDEDFKSVRPDIEKHFAEKEISTKNSVADEIRNDAGLPKVEIPKDRTEAEGVAKGKELVDSGDVDPLNIVNELLSDKDIYEKNISPNDEPVMRYYLLQLHQKGLELNKDNAANNEILAKEPENAEATIKQADLSQKLLRHYDELGRALDAERIGGNIWHKYGEERKGVINEQGQVINSINRTKAAYGDKVPPEVQKQLVDLQKRYDELTAKNKLLEDSAKETEAQHQADRIGADIEHQKKIAELEKKIVSGKKYTVGAKKLADQIRSLKTKPFTFTDKDGNQIEFKQNSIVPYNDIIEGIAKAVEAGGKLADKVKDILDGYSDEAWYKNLDKEDREKLAEQLAEHLTPNGKKESGKSKTSDGKTISHDMLRDIVASGKTDIGDIVKEVKERTGSKASDREIRDAITKYGKTINLNKEEVEVALRKAKRIGRVISSLEDIAEKKRPLRSGLQRDKLDAEERALGKQLKEEMKGLPMDEADQEKQLKTSLDAIKTRLRNHIEDLNREIETGEKAAKAKGVPYDDEARALVEERDTVKKIHDEIFGKTELTNEQKIDRAIKATERATKVVDQKISENDLETKKSKLPDDPKLKADREKLKARKEVLDKLREDAGIPERKKLEQRKRYYAKRETELTDNLKNNKFAAAVKLPTEKPPRIIELEKQLAEAKKKALNEDHNLSAEDLKRKTASIQKQIDNGNYGKMPVKRVTFEDNPEWIKNNQARVKILDQLHTLQDNAMDSQKNKYMKALDWTNRWGNRVIFFGANAVYTKLSSAAVLGSFVHRIPEKLIGGGFGKLLPKISEKAPIYGSMPNVRSEGKFYSEFLNPKSFLRNSFDQLWNGKTDLSREFGGKYGQHHLPGVDLFAADLHAIIKNPVKRATFESAYISTLQHFAKNGIDYTHPLMIESARQAAYRAAENEIFQGNDGNAGAVKSFFNELEKKGIINANMPDLSNKAKGNVQYAAASLFHFFVPINTVPTNILSRVYNGFPAVFAIKTISAFAKNAAIEKGILKLTQPESEMIMRDLQKGAIGSAYWTLGFFLMGGAGGLYTKYYPDKKRGNEPVSDALNIGGMDISKNVQHNTQLTSFQMGATWSRVYNHYIDDKGASQAEAIAAATAATGGASLKQIPTVKAAADIYSAATDPNYGKHYVKQLKNRVGIGKATTLMNLMGYGDSKESNSEPSDFQKQIDELRSEGRNKEADQLMREYLKDNAKK